MAISSDADGRRHGWSRRDVLRTGGALALGTVAEPLGRWTTAFASAAPLPSRAPVRVAVVGVSRTAPVRALTDAVRDAALAATDFSWLRRGDRVLLKVVCNSPNPYPATTHPTAIAAMTAFLRDRGATVIVGDQSGVQFVHHTRSAQRGSTRA